MTGKLIQQQMYTRERGGVFHSTDGYDTIALSENLDKAFVKKYLHPFCIYHAPKSLAERGEKAPGLYPPAVTFFQPETGDLVVGQAVFVPADFTGQRSTYFVHNYIIPPEQKEGWIKQPERWFQLKDFSVSHDRELGNVLPERETVNSTSHDILLSKSELLEKLGISDVHFKQLLFAVMASIAGKKKVFISLNVPLEDYSKYALQLLELITVYLPYAHRRRLGAITFTSEPETKNYIHVVFFEPGTLNAGDRSIEKQYIFDFAAGRMSGADIEGQQHEYLEFAMHHFSEGNRIDEFFNFAERALSGLPDEQKLELTSYYQLTAIYLTLVFNTSTFYKKNKVGFLHSLQKFLMVNSEAKSDFVELFIKLVSEESRVEDVPNTLDYIQAVVSINTIVKSDEALAFILETLAYYQNDPLFHQLWKVLEQEHLGYEAILTYINTHHDYGQLLERYLDERFRPLVRTENILKELSRMLSSSFLLGIDKFTSVAFKKVASSIRTESNPFTAVLTVLDFKMNRDDMEFIIFKNELAAHAKFALLRSIHLKDLTMKDILTFGKIFPKEVHVKDSIDILIKENYQIMNALYQLISIPSQAGTYSLHSLTSTVRAHIQSTLMQILKNQPVAEHLPLLYVAFNTEQNNVDLKGVLDYLIRYSDSQTLLSFIRGNVRRIETDPAFKQSVRKYLINHPNSIWKNKVHRKELKLIRNRSFITLLKEVETETASPLIKFFRKNGMKVGLSLVIAGGVGGGAWFGYEKLFADDAKPKVGIEKASGTAEARKGAKEEKKLDSGGISLEEFLSFTPADAGNQSFVLSLEGKEVQTINGQADGVTLIDKDQNKFQLSLPTEKSVPFDMDAAIKNGYTFYGMEYELTGDDHPELVLVANDKKIRSYLWIYSFQTDGADSAGSLPPKLILTKQDISEVRLEKDNLILTRENKKVTYSYAPSQNKLIEQ